MDFSVSSKLESRGFNTTEIFRLLLHRSWGVKNCQQGRRIEKTAISPLSPDILCLRSSSCYQCVSFLSFPSPSLGPYSSSLILFSSLSPWYFLKCSVYVQQKERSMWPLLLHSWLWTLEIQVRMKIISISETAHRKKNAEPCTWYHWHQIYLEIQTVKFHRSKARWEQALHCTQVSAASQQCDCSEIPSVAFTKPHIHLSKWPKWLGTQFVFWLSGICIPKSSKDLRQNVSWEDNILWSGSLNQDFQSLAKYYINKLQSQTTKGVRKTLTIPCLFYPCDVRL